MSRSLATIPQGMVRRRSGEESPTQRSKWRLKWRGRSRPGAKEEITRSDEHSCWRGLREQEVSGRNSQEGERKCSWVSCRESRLPAASKIGFLAAQATVWVWDRMFPGEKTCRTCTQQAWTSNKQTPEGARESRGAAGVGLKRWSRQGKSKKDKTGAIWSEKDAPQ